MFDSRINGLMIDLESPDLKSYELILDTLILIT